MKLTGGQLVLAVTALLVAYGVVTHKPAPSSTASTVTGSTAPHPKRECGDDLQC